MLKALKHISPKTKILFIVFILILLPGAILSYLGIQSIDQNAESLRTKYLGTINLIRDKLENEIIKLEENLRNSLIEQFPAIIKDNDLQKLLRIKESENPVFKHLFLINTDDGIMSSSLSLNWNKSGQSRSFKNPQMTNIINLAEKAEFIEKDLANAVALYRKTLAYATSPQERSLLLSRIGRCYFKMEKFKEGINAYKKILKLRNEHATIGNVPASIAALSQIADGYKAMKVPEEHYDILLELYQRLLDHPWDLAEGDYLHYLRSTSKEIQGFNLPDSGINSSESNIQDLIKREGKLLEQIRFLRHIYDNLVNEIRSNLKGESSSELHPYHFSWNKGISTHQAGYFKISRTFQQTHLLAFGYQIDNAYILSKVLPGVLTNVDLGKDVFVGLLNEKDSLLYPPQDQLLNNYLVAQNFTQLFIKWKVAIFDRDGKSIGQLVGRERQFYLALFTGIIVIMLIGIVFTVRAVIHESEVSRIRSEFVSNVSHELKTPLALIRMFGETLDTGVVTDEKKRREFYGIIRKESERLTHLINNVLDFSKVDSGTKEYNFGEADLVKVVRDSLEAYKFHIRDLGFEIKSKLPDKLVMPKIDKDAISQVLLNLLSNAVKYSDNRKYIGVEVRRNPSSALISVTDHGMGISKEQMKKIFDKFYRVPTSEVKETRGSGLGLTLAKHIVEAHDGSIDVESEVGKGSSFTIKIPL
jgi:signal transduction histidine kinase